MFWPGRQGKIRAMGLTLHDFDYDLPEELIAQHPADRRDTSRLMVVHHQPLAWEHRGFSDLPDLLRPGDVLVLNDTRVLPAKFLTRRASGGRIEGLFLRAMDKTRWEVMLRNAGRCKPGELLRFVGLDGRDVREELELCEPLEQGRWIVRPVGEDAAPQAVLDRVGSVPLPPYIRRHAGGNAPEDRQRYQTVYADRPGAVAAPTAGLHFTEDILATVQARGVDIVRVTLHVGLGTFLPVKTDNLREHEMHREWYDLSADAAERIMTAKRQQRRVIAVGTTSVRVLESVARRHDGGLVADAGWTDLFLYPPAEVYVVDGLLTNFHLPKSTLLMLVASVLDPGGVEGVRAVRSIYTEAVQQHYRFFSYGDAMLIL